MSVAMKTLNALQICHCRHYFIWPLFTPFANSRLTLERKRQAKLYLRFNQLSDTLNLSVYTQSFRPMKSQLKEQTLLYVYPTKEQSLEKDQVIFSRHSRTSTKSSPKESIYILKSRFIIQNLWMSLGQKKGKFLIIVSIIQPDSQCMVIQWRIGVQFLGRTFEYFKCTWFTVNPIFNIDFGWI